VLGEEPPAAPAPAPIAVHVVGRGLRDAVLATAPVGDPRMFVVERGGRIRILEGGSTRARPFLDLRGEVSMHAEHGLLGMAFDPDYTNNGYFFVQRTTPDGHSIVSRFSVSSNPYLADADSELVLMYITQVYTGNRGGALAFGPDGFLYVGIGDGGEAYDPRQRAQNGLSFHGKILRIDVAQPPAADSLPTGTYAIPAGNPFMGNPLVRDEIWAIGVRDPHRLSFDRETGDLWIADQGHALKQELNVEQIADGGGHNYGWDIREGTSCNPLDPSAALPCSSDQLTDPVFEYSNAESCAIAGGFVYRGALPDLDGEYFFADLCSGALYSYNRAAKVVTERTAEASIGIGGGLDVVGLGEGGSGELYILDARGSVYRLRGLEPECSDGVDNDGDGKVDYVSDAGCIDAMSNTENPVCNDGIDNDLDGKIDSLDSMCAMAFYTTEGFSQTEVDEIASLCGLGAELVLIFPPMIWLRQRRRMKRMERRLV
jgi:glucose/arabinose dehydrogenase